MRLPSAAPSLVRPGSLVLLAPAAAAVPDGFGQTEVDAAQHATLLSGLQRLRGDIYLRDGAITEQQLTADGCHVQAVDDASWHVVSLQPDGRVMACARLRVHGPQTTCETLGIWNSALARDDHWSARLRSAVESDMALARGRNMAYAELGGWAVAEEWRRTTQVVTTALAVYALAEAVGGCICVTTATVRHCSSRILRKLGGRSLEADGESLPSYFDPQYGCEMEILRFDSGAPSSKYTTQVLRLAHALRGLPVVCATAGLRPAHAEAPQGLLPTLAALAERHVPCFGAGEFAPA